MPSPTEVKPYACKVMAPLQSYLQHTSDAKKEAELMEKLTKLDATGEAGIVRFKVRLAISLFRWTGRAAARPS